MNDRTPVGAASVAKLANRTLGLLRRRGASLPATEISADDLDAETEWLGEGYGHRTPEAEEARESAAAREGLEVDPVYTAKALAALLTLRERGAFGAGPVLYWHSHDTVHGGTR